MIKKEDKYIIIKQTDLEDLQNIVKSPITGFIGGRGVPYISSDDKKEIKEELESLQSLLNRIDNQNKYIVYNQDEPYAEIVWQIILGGEALKKCKQND